MARRDLSFEAFWRRLRDHAETYASYDDGYHHDVILNIVRHEGAMRELYVQFLQQPNEPLPPPWDTLVWDD